MAAKSLVIRILILQHYHHRLIALFVFMLMGSMISSILATLAPLNKPKNRMFSVFVCVIVLKSLAFFWFLLRFDLFAFWFFLVFVFCVIFVGVWLDTEFFEFLEILWDLLFWVCFAFTGFVLLCCKSCESLKLFLLLFLLDFVFTILLLFFKWISHLKHFCYWFRLF